MKLTKRERHMLNLLSLGRSYQRIADTFKITRECLHVHMHHIRRKTGIKSTRDAVECRNYIRASREPQWPKGPLPPSPRQLQVMRLIAEGRTYNEIVCLLQCGFKTAMNHATQGCKRAGLLHAGRNRPNAIRTWLAARENPMNDPMF